jgi:hypothetical protein
VLDNVVAVGVLLDARHDDAPAVSVSECDVHVLSRLPDADEATADVAAFALSGRAVELGHRDACGVGLHVTGVAVD